MDRVREPRAISAVLIFAMIFMVGFGIWHAPVLDFASKAVPHFGKISSVVSVSPSQVSRTAKAVYVHSIASSSRDSAAMAIHFTSVTH